MAMSIRSSISSCSSRHLQASVLRPSYLSANDRDRCRFLGNRSFLQPLIMKVESGSRKKMAVVVNSVEPGAPLPSDPSGINWKLWLVGMLFSVAIPFWKNKWWPLQNIKAPILCTEKFSTALDTVEDVAEVVEKVAGQVEKVADDIADHLPEGRLQEAARIVESVAREAGKDAALADDLIEKVEEVEKEVDSIIEQANKKIEEENDTDDQTAKIKDATEIKTKIAEIKETNSVKKETTKS
ncbi:uncharacterized protein LOC103940295 isoform X2 [Pyrus x bretschneideri]|uniref:uncharacterized protein LOC103940295 isoform X2 n=1 Tax=Pyrus x bretschneideri TaxID=225117 RepID=UPI002030E715|nr:uncharacterized protein LOC103940295 isoform X2 [Pyrus x bretschneideri]